MTSRLHLSIEHHKIDAFWRLFRLDKPIGIELLLWPTLWSLFLAAGKIPSLINLIIFTTGVVLMRSAGCAINDFADRDFDKQVARTYKRPLAAGELTPKEALFGFLSLALLSASLLFWLPISDFYWSLGAVVLATSYPFMKRFTHFPQVVLGAAFSWAIPMAFVAETHWPDLLCWSLFAANLAWTVAYDTQYAMTDRSDDLKAGVKSTAVFLKNYDNLFNITLQMTFALLMGVSIYKGNTSLLWLVLFGLITLAGFSYQFWLTRERIPEKCFKAFQANKWIGRGVFIIVVGSVLYPNLML